MSLLRIRCSLADPRLRCDWALIDVGRETLTGSGQLADLTRLARDAERIQLVIPAAEVLLARAKLPPGAGPRSGALLAYAVEDLTIGDPESQHVIFLGSSASDETLCVLAIMDKKGHEACLAAVDAIGVNNFEVHHEALLLPWRPGEWTLAWDGGEGYLRSGEREAGAIDCGDKSTPPLALRLLSAAAIARGAPPSTLAVYTVGDSPEAAPDIEAWSSALGIKLRLAGTWDWRRAPPEAGIALETRRRRWRLPAPALQRLKPAMWILCAAMLIHAVALIVDWSLLASERRQLRQQMESRFRAAFPDAVAVVDPALQMRRKLAEARHAAGAVDDGDFLPMAEKVAMAMRETAPGSLRSLSYESGRMTLDVAGDSAALQRLGSRLSQAGLRLDQDVARAAAHPGSGKSQLTVRAQ